MSKQWQCGNNMSLRNLNLGASFEEIISKLPGGLSNYTLNISETAESTADMTNDESRARTPFRAQPSTRQTPTTERPRSFQSTSASNNEQAIFLHSIYNTISMGLLLVCLGICFLLYYVLQAFIRPILWAVLTSAFLFSFKRYITDSARSRLVEIEKRKSTLAMEMAFLPLNLVDSIMDFTWSLTNKRSRQLFMIISFILLFHLGTYFSKTLLHFLSLLITYMSSITNLMAYNYIVDQCSRWQFSATLAGAYLLAVVFYWNESNTLHFQIMSLPIWMSLSLLASRLLGPYRPWLMLVFLVLTCIGFYSILNELFKKQKNKFRLRRSASKNNKSTLNTNKSAIFEEEIISGNLKEASPTDSIDHDEESERTEDDEYEDTVEVDESTDELRPMQSELNASSASQTSDSSANTEHSFLKTTLLNVYQTSVYYFHTSMNQSSRSSRRQAATGQTAAETRKKENSDKYFILLFWLFVFVKVRFDFYIVIPILVILWKLGKYLTMSVITVIVTNPRFEIYSSQTKQWIERRKEILVPKPFKLLFKLFVRGDRKVNQILQRSMDNLVTALIIMFLLMALITSTIALVMQVQSESSQSINILSNIVNENLYAKPEWREWLPEKEKLTKLYQTFINNFYVYGREWLSKTLKSSPLFEPTGSTPSPASKSEFLALESQLLEQWDSLYAYLSQKTTANGNKTSHTVNIFSTDHVVLLPSSLNSTTMVGGTSGGASATTVTVGTQTSVFDTLSATRKNFASLFKYKELAIIVKDNLGILMSVLDSIYAIVKGNINLFVTILYTVISTIFSSSFALMNFFFSFIVYMTALFYLLSMSGARFKPLQVLTEINVLKSGSGRMSRSQLISKAIEESISSVFVASFKMALFFGLYTYTINCMFGVNIVYLPSIISALFAVLPLIGTYWFCVPGVLELWLLYDSPILAILFICMHLLPYILSVDRAIYSEIKGGHPYLTGLAFAGGVYCLGLEGAIIGPIILCLFIVIGKVLAGFSASSSSSSLRNSVSLSNMDQTATCKTPTTATAK